MTQKDFERKLTSILSADAVGYSRLMEENEEATVRTITFYRKVIATLIKQHNGKVIDAPGDNLLAEFVSVVDAVRSAVAVQKEIKTRNEELPKNRRMLFRIGINLGDVIQEGDRIYGDGVNIAARLEGLAAHGGICISRTAFDQVKNKLDIGYEYLGEHSVKNITEPVRVYKVLMEPESAGKVLGESRKTKRPMVLATAIVLLISVVGLAGWYFYIVQSNRVKPASLDRMVYPLPDKPSIAVLPFDNMSGDPDQDYLCDGISDNIISALSQISEMFVIARNSTFVYKGKAVKVSRVAEELGVRYVLEGSVQKSGDRIRVIAQLIDAMSGHHLWSEKYDRTIKDFFQLLDDITHKIVVALQVKLTHGEQMSSWTRQTNNFDAWGYAVKGFSLFEHLTKVDNARAREIVKQALKIDPNYAYAWTLLAWTHLIDARAGYSNRPQESIIQAIQIAQKTSALDDTIPELHSLKGTIYLVLRKHEKAISEGQKSIELGPSNAVNYAILAQIMYYSGRFDEAIALAQQSMRLCPYHPSYYLFLLGMGYHGAGRLQDAVSIFDKLLERAQRGEFPLEAAHGGLAAIYASMSEYSKAQKHLTEALKINPNLSLEYVRKISFYKNPAHLESVLNALREAGLN